ncbi:hypothetical protein [Tsukamurella sp. NPDC003166]|uniref:hypothetical protein n=1 Tax=Tsukamurella sp. NPDC003166 TaxID=3154444 RepID=UPI0033AB3904
MIRLRVAALAAAVAAGTTLLLPATAFAAPHGSEPSPHPAPAPAKSAPAKPAPAKPAPAKPAPAKPAPAKPAPAKPAADPLTGFVCTVIGFLPGGLQTVQSTLQTVGTAEKELVAGAHQIAPGPADAYKAFRAPIDAQVNALLTACAGAAR